MANKKTLDKKKQLQHLIKISLVMLLIMSLKEPL
jgi:hypothetical protein